MLDIDAIPFDALPDESESLEFKSSRISAKQLAKELPCAASAFWNSGGGVLIVGVDNAGEVDGGILPNVGNTPLNDWLAQVVGGVQPKGQYRFRLFDESNLAAASPGRVVLAIEFAESAFAPHQSTDKTYYIRVGPQTMPAPHFIVEALFAKRHFRSPKLVHLLQRNHYTMNSDFLHVAIVAATDGVALDVVIDLDPRQAGKHSPFPITVPIVDRAHPFAFRFEIPHEPLFAATLRVHYRDLVNSHFTYETAIDASQCVNPYLRDDGVLGAIATELSEVKEKLKHGHGLGVAVFQ